MAGNNRRLIFNVDGDVSGLRRALSDGEGALRDFGEGADDILGGLSGQVKDLAGKLGLFSGGLVGTAGALGVVVGGVYALVSASNDYVKTYNEVAKTSSLSVEQLQKLDKQFTGLGFTIEKFGDLNRDVLDHLGDAFRDGSGPAEDMKAYGINIKDFNKYLNQSDGGIRAVAEAFYQMRKAGKSTAEITNMLETLGSDGSKLVGVFSQYKDVTELMNSVQSQHAILTDETAQKYAEFDKKITQISTSFQLWKAEALGPTLDDIQMLFDLMNKDWSKTDFWQMFQNFYYGGDNGIAKMLRQLDGIDPATIPGTKEYIEKHKPTDTPKTETTTPKDGWVNKEKEAAAAKAAAQKAEAAAKQAAAKRIQAEKDLQNALSNIGLSDGDIRIKTFNRQQDAIVESIKKNSATLKLDAQTTTGYLTQAYDSRTKKFKEMIDDMIGYSDPNKDLRQLSQNIAAVGSNLTGEQAQRLMDAQNQRVGLKQQGTDADNPWDNSKVLDQKRKDLEAQRDLELTINEQTSRQLNLSQEQYQKRKKAIQEKYNAQALAVETDNTKAQMGILSDSAGSLGTILAGAFSSGSRAAEAAFAIQKGLSIAQTVMNIQTALSGALATPFPANLANYAQILSLGASIITTAKGAASGKAHSGIDSVPGSGDQTWILKAGERVVQPEANKKLTSFLDNQNSQKQSDGQQMVVNAPLIIQGGSTDDDAKFQAMLKKHQNSVSQAVKNAQTRTT